MRSFVCIMLLLRYVQSFRSIARSVQLRMSSVESHVDLGLTPVLKGYAEGLRNVIDEKLRYQQLLYLAAKCPQMDDKLKMLHNKVPGCLSTVYVHASMDAEGKVNYVGDSDSQLTKGLVTMLVNGLSGHSYVEIERVNPAFVQYAGVAQSLTPGRNNGFLNMLHLMKTKAKALEQRRLSGEVGGDDVGNDDSIMSAVETTENIGGENKMYQSIMKKLSLLKPVSLVVEDESRKHAGHAGVKDINRREGKSGSSGSGETHFNVNIVASCFEGMSRVQRHQMVYTLLAQDMSNGIHALSISARTPDENA